LGDHLKDFSSFVMEAVKSARKRFQTFPKLLADCSKQASAYAKCVVQTDDPKQNLCEKEFTDFRMCLQKASKTRGMRI